MANDATGRRDRRDETIAAPTLAGGLRRRGLVAAAAATVAGLAASKTAPPVAAATTDTSFTATGTATNFSARGTAAYGLSTYNGIFAIGVLATGSDIGVEASSSSTGVGVNASGGAYGIQAFSPGIGVLTAGGTFGVQAFSDGTGVVAQGSGNGATGVRASTDGTGTYGVLATTTGPGSVACSGQATGFGSYGVYGTSTTSHGIYGITAAPGASSVYGYTTARGAAAISGVAGSGAYAGSFMGPVVVNGDFVAFGGVKSAAVPHRDGSHRLVYCVEAAEPWLEDFGEGRLVGGKAEVTLDPDFAAVADTKRMHVFLTEEDEHAHLVVKGKRAEGFAVEADGQVAAMKGKKLTELNSTFSYRVVARRKDIKGERLARFVLPKGETAPPPVPQVSVPPKVPERQPGR